LFELCDSFRIIDPYEYSVRWDVLAAFDGYFLDPPVDPCGDIEPRCIGLALYEQRFRSQEIASQLRHLGPPVAYLHAESGDLNTLVHLWAFDDAGDRAQKRAAMMRDPEWLNYLKLADEAGYLVDQRNSLMVPASFAPIKR